MHMNVCMWVFMHVCVCVVCVHRIAGTRTLQQSKEEQVDDREGERKDLFLN